MAATLPSAPRKVYRVVGTYAMAPEWRPQHFELRLEGSEQEVRNVEASCTRKIVYQNFDSYMTLPHGKWICFNDVLRLLFDYEGREWLIKNAWFDRQQAQGETIVKFTGVDWQNRDVKIDFLYCQRLKIIKKKIIKLNTPPAFA